MEKVEGNGGDGEGSKLCWAKNDCHIKHVMRNSDQPGSL